jgi:hypothetical protein
MDSYILIGIPGGERPECLFCVRGAERAKTFGAAAT